MIKLAAVAFSVLAAVPQALKGMAYGLGRMNDCALPATTCMISDVDQSHVLNMLYGPSFWTTTGLWIGGVGAVISIAAMRVIDWRDNADARKAMDRVERQAELNARAAGGGRTDGNAKRGNEYGRMPRPGYGSRSGRDDRR